MKINPNIDFEDEFDIDNLEEITWTFTVPSTPNFLTNRYVIYLPQIPYINENYSSKYPTIEGLYRVEGKQPSAGEFRTVAAGTSTEELVTAQIPHRIEFNEAQAGQTFTIVFWGGIASNINIDDINNLEIAQYLNGGGQNYQEVPAYNQDGTIDTVVLKDVDGNTVTTLKFTYNTDGSVATIYFTLNGIKYTKTYSYDSNMNWTGAVLTKEEV